MDVYKEQELYTDGFKAGYAQAIADADAELRKRGDEHADKAVSSSRAVACGRFLGSIGVDGDTAACGKWNPEKMTGRTPQVTCSVCRQTREFRFARRDPSTRSPQLAAYERPEERP